MSSIVHTIRLVASAKEAISEIHKYRDEVVASAQKVRAIEASLGGDKILQSAHNYTAAVKELGGAQRLTASEQARVNGVLTEAIAKYKVLGQTAPAALRELEEATRKVEQKQSLLSTALGKFGPMLAATFSVGAIAGGLRSLVTWADDIDEVSTGLGVGVEWLQKYQHAWATTGSSVQAGIRAIQTMQEKLADGTSRAAIGRLGLDFNRIRQLAPERQFEEITAALADVTDEARQSADGADIFGKAWKSVGISVKNGMQEAAAGARALTEEEIRNIAALQAKWEGFLLWLKVSAGKVVSGGFAPDYYARGGTTTGFASATVGRVPGEIQLPTMPSSPASPFGFGAGVPAVTATAAEVAAIEQATKALAYRLSPAAASAAKALRETEIAAAISTARWMGGVEFDRQWALRAAIDAGAWFNGQLPRGQWAAPMPSGFGASSILDADVQQALGSMQWQNGNPRLDTAPTGGGTLFNRYFGAASSIGGLLVGALGTGTLASVAGGALSGAGTGAAIGSAVPGVGTAVGASVGAIAGAIAGYFKRRKADKEAESTLANLRTQLVETYGSIEAASDAALALGVSIDTVWTAQKAKGLEQATIVLEQFNAALTKDAALITALGSLDPGEVLSKSLRGQIGGGLLSQDARAALGAFITGQTDTLLSTVQAYVEGGGSLEGAVGRGMFSAAMAGAGQARANGMSFADLASTMSPWLGTLSNQTGMSSGFLDLINSASRPEVAAILASSDQIGTVAATMENLGLLNQETFGDLTTGLSDAYEELVGQGVQGNDALRLLQPSLQQMYELVQDYGYAADAATQAMIDQAQEQGLIGEAFRSSEEQLKTSIDRLIEASIDLAAAFRGVAPYGAGYGDDSDQERERHSYESGTDGYRWFGSGTPAMLHGWEAVVRPGDPMPPSSAAARRVEVKAPIVLKVGSQTLAEVVVRALAAEVN